MTTEGRAKLEAELEKLKNEDLKEIAVNFGEFHETVKPPLIKIGHSEEQPFAGDLPALGWIDNVRKEDGKLLADFMEVPAVVADLIRKRAYKRVSPEIYSDYVDSDGINHGKVLRAVVLEGAEIPAFKDLKDVQALYQKSEFEDEFGKWTIYIKAEKGGDMAEERLEKVEKTTESLLDENIKLKVEKFMEDNKEKVLPTFQPLLKEMLIQTARDDGKVIKFKEENEDKEFKLNEAIRELVTRLPKLVEFDELGKASGEAVDKDTEEYNRIQKLASESKISFEEAEEKLRTEGKLA